MALLPVPYIMEEVHLQVRLGPVAQGGRMGMAAGTTMAVSEGQEATTRIR